jgi:phage shock protein A
MGVLNRFVDVVNSNLNAALDKAEKPEHMLRLIMQDMEEALIEARTHAASLIAEKKKIARELDSLAKQQLDWERKAELALSKDREDLAKDALMQKNALNNEVEQLTKHVEHISKDLETIGSETQALNVKFSEVKEKYNGLARRKDTATVQHRSKAATCNRKIDAINIKYEQLQQKVIDIESQVEAIDLTSGSVHDAFAKLEAESAVDEELAALKLKLKG